MRKINIEKLINERSLDKRKVAEILFPRARWPILALKRVIKGEALLNSDQISRLALFAKVSLSYLFTGEGWGCKSKGRLHTFTCEDFTALVDMVEGKVDMFHKNTLFHSENLISKSIELTELVDMLNKQILNYEA